MSNKIKIIIGVFILLNLVIVGLLFFNKKNTDNKNNKTLTTGKMNNPIVTIKTNFGDMKFELYKQDAPNTVANFIKLAKEGFYNGTKFHRVIQDFMIQGGDPLSKDDSQKSLWGTGGPGYKFNDEINSHKLVQGSLAMANSGPNTNGSQFFIVTTQSTPWLDGSYTNFGQITSGMDVALNIEVTPTDDNDRPLKDVIINSVEVQE